MRATISVKVKPPLNYDPKSIKALVRAASKHYGNSKRLRLTLDVRARTKRPHASYLGGDITIHCPKSGIDKGMLCGFIRWHIAHCCGLPPLPVTAFEPAWAFGLMLMERPKGFAIELPPEPEDKAARRREGLKRVVQKRSAQAVKALHRLEEKHAKLQRDLGRTRKALVKARARVRYYEEKPSEALSHEALAKKLEDKLSGTK